MNGSRFLPLALSFSVLLVSEGAAQSAKTCKCSPTPCCEAGTDEVVCKVYPLAAVDPDTAAWIAKTIPDVVEPSSWRPAGGKAILSFFPPKRIMVVTQTAEGHRRIDAFLKEVCHASATTAGHAPATGFATTAATAPITSTSPGLLPAHMSTVPAKIDAHTEPKTTVSKSTERRDGSPRHLFHIVVDGLDSSDMKIKNFTLKYEGEGLIDANIVELLKGIGPQTWSETIPSLPSATYLKNPPMCAPESSNGPIPASAVTLPGTVPTPRTTGNPNTPAMPATPIGPPVGFLPAGAFGPIPLAPTGFVPPPMTSAPIPVMTRPPFPTAAPVSTAPIPVSSTGSAPRPPVAPMAPAND